MSRLRLTLLSIIAVLAVSAVGATAAQARQGPYYKVATKRLKAVESKTIINAAASAAGFTLKTGAPVVEIHCGKLKVSGLIIGSNTTNGSASKETITFEECTQSGNGPATCKVEGGIVKTEPLIDRLAYAAAAPVKGTKFLVIFYPEEMSASFPSFATIKFVGAGCIAATIGVEPEAVGGAVAGEVWSGGAAVKFEEEPAETEIGQVNFPAANKAWVEDSGVLTEVKCGLVITGGIKATLTGLSSFELEGKPKWVVSAL